MKAKTQSKEYLLKFLMQSNSLHDLLGILANICENLDLDYLNPRIKHFKYFQFTFFGLLVKAKSLLDMMIFRCEFLKNNISELNETYLDLLKLKRKIEAAYNCIDKNKMAEGKNKIIEAASEYLKTFEIINIMVKRLV